MSSCARGDWTRAVRATWRALPRWHCLALVERRQIGCEGPRSGLAVTHARSRGVGVLRALRTRPHERSPSPTGAVDWSVRALPFLRLRADATSSPASAAQRSWEPRAGVRARSCERFGGRCQAQFRAARSGLICRNASAASHPRRRFGAAMCRARERWRRPGAASAHSLPADLRWSARPNRPPSAGDPGAAALPRALHSGDRVHVVLCSHPRRRALVGVGLDMRRRAHSGSASRRRRVDPSRAPGASRVRSNSQPTSRRTMSNSVRRSAQCTHPGSSHKQKHATLADSDDSRLGGGAGR
ncbi:hypothetical protein B0H10DRAFT_1293707 [Mycena sp. CBHHK59/15]|nr:hypothetical protein B0H10DRAFT_1293707 [Mycena sp. CBHHK59/15]